MLQRVLQQNLQQRPVPSTHATTAQPATEPSGNAVYGEVNGDGDITVVDATLVQKHVVQLETLRLTSRFLLMLMGIIQSLLLTQH